MPEMNLQQYGWERRRDGWAEPQTCLELRLHFLVQVMIHRNQCDTYLLLNVLLTLLAWLPGMIHAMWVVLYTPASPREELGYHPLTRPHGRV